MARLPIDWDKPVETDGRAPEEQLSEFIGENLRPLKPVSVILDRKVRRFAVEGDRHGEKSGWYVGFSDNLPAAACGSWRGDVRLQWRASGAQYAADYAEWRERVEELRQIAEEERKKERARAAASARKIFAEAAPADASHPYLQRKKVGCYGLKVTGDGRLIMPVCKDSEIISLQYIAPDGEKRFHTGGETKGGGFLIGEIASPDATVCIAEGYATGASVYEATGCPVLVALNAGNLPAAAKRLREILPQAKIIIVGDNDASGTGQKAAGEAAAACGGRAVIPPLQGDANDYAAAGHDLAALISGRKKWLVSADDFCEKPAPIKWLVKKWLQREGLAMIFGESGAGKTFVALDWALRIASGGGEWCGLKVAGGNAVYLAGEGHYGMKARVAGWKIRYDIKKLSMWISESACDLNLPDGYALAESAIRETGAADIAVIFVDTLHRFLAGDENKALDVKAMLDNCARLREIFHAAVVLVHHTGVGQDAKERARGSSAWRGALDNQILVSVCEDKIKLTQVKNKDGELAEPVLLEKTPVTLPGWRDDDGEPVSTLILEPAPPEPDIGPKMTKAQADGIMALNAALQALPLGPGGILDGAPEIDWRAKFYEEKDEISQRTLIKAFYRAKQELIKNGRVESPDGGKRWRFAGDYAIMNKRVL